jgi:hypothetical protein
MQHRRILSLFTDNDEQFLIRAINQNRAVLFLGAGASQDAKNKLGSQMPLSRELAADMYKWLEFEGEYDDTPLTDMYEAILKSGRPFSQIEDLLESRLLCSEVPGQYDTLAIPSWYRIYTTNADDLLDLVWRRATQASLDVLRYPKDDIHERDQLLSRFQAIYLNGKLPCRPDELTFSTRQFAQRAISHEPLYEQFVRDYTSHPVVFLGTELNEPLFWQYIAVREARGQAASEQRPKSFLVSNHISPAKRVALKDLNVVPVEASTVEFLSWIAGKSSEIQNREEVLKYTIPSFSIVAGVKASRESGEFAIAFHNVPLTNKAGAASRSTYLLGTTPKWEDILNDLDAPRTITRQIVDTVTRLHSSNLRLQIIPILGSAGCGKSTILRRIGLTLAQSGLTTFLTNCEQLPRPGSIARALDTIPTRAVLLFDNAEGALGLLPAIARELSTVDRPPILLVATKTNDYDRKVGKFDDECNITEFFVPHLDPSEILAVLVVLERHHLLGRLRGMSQSDRVREFQIRANRQILIAMREATTGRGFDDIIKNEFTELSSDEAKILYLCTALATDAGYRIRKDELVGCTTVRPAEAMYLINRSLRDIVLPTGVGEDLLLLRHRLIAEFMVDGAAPRNQLAIAYIRLLRVLAGQLGDRSWRSRTFGFYRDVINHRTIYRRFSGDIDTARDIYESLREYFATDPQFWLQYGSLELEANVLDLAENYLAQALSLDPGDRFIKNAMGHLMLRKAIDAETKTQSLKFREEGSEILLEQIFDHEAADIHCYHIYCSQRLGWIRKWGSSFDERKQEFEDLRNIILRACDRFPRARELVQLREDIERDYLSLAVAINQS